MGRVLVVSILVRAHIHIGHASSLWWHHVLWGRHIWVDLALILRGHFWASFSLLLLRRILLLLLSLRGHLLLLVGSLAMVLTLENLVLVTVFALLIAL